MSEEREEKHTPEQLLNLYPALTKLLAYISGTEKVAITLAMEEYSREQLAKERQLRKELYQATYDWTNHMELWLEEAKFRIDSADLEDLKALIQQGEKAIQKAKGT